jgi:hypothetical protein
VSVAPPPAATASHHQSRPSNGLVQRGSLLVSAPSAIRNVPVGGSAGALTIDGSLSASVAAPSSADSSGDVSPLPAPDSARERGTLRRVASDEPELPAAGNGALPNAFFPARMLSCLFGVHYV